LELSLSAKNAVVCGSSQGIGKAVAIELARLGARVTLVARNEQALRQAVKELQPQAAHDYVVADFTRPEELWERIQRYASSHEPVHVLVNNTGGPPSGTILDAEADAFVEAFQQHLISNHLLVQTFVPGMKGERYGRIINIVSTSVKQPIRNLGVSNTTRWAVAGWAKTLATELAPFGITVNNLLPGATKTERLFSLFEARARQSGKTPDDIAAEWLSEIPAGRFGEPSEIAAAAAFLASPAASYINGINLPVDGGRLGCL
jgi:3-oxoacyl-[acyl-carrier protein] reductase